MKTNKITVVKDSEHRHLFRFQMDVLVCADSVLFDREKWHEDWLSEIHKATREMLSIRKSKCATAK